MATGHRVLRCPMSVRAGFGKALVDGGYDLAVSGGAEGADIEIAWGAVDVGVPFVLLLPNRFYRQVYPRSIPDELYDLAAEVEYAVDRDVAQGEDPVAAWHARRWWTDNFVRNGAMGRRATDAAVCSSTHPRALSRPGLSGGTAHCVRTLVAQGYTSALWVRDVAAPSVKRVALADPSPSLFDDVDLSQRAE
jgi:hypothetical protein